MSTEPEGIRVELKGIHIEAFLAGGGERLWRVATDQIQVVGEYTTSAGPYMEDYFLVFVRDRNTWYEVPVSATGMDRLLQSLSRHLESELSLNLGNSVDLRSRVLWPSTPSDPPRVSNPGACAPPKWSLPKTVALL